MSAADTSILCLVVVVAIIGAMLIGALLALHWLVDDTRCPRCARGWWR